MKAKSIALQVLGHYPKSVSRHVPLPLYKRHLYTKLNMTAQNVLYFDVWGLGRSDRDHRPFTVTDRENEIRKE